MTLGALHRAAGSGGQLFVVDRALGLAAVGDASDVPRPRCQAASLSQFSSRLQRHCPTVLTAPVLPTVVYMLSSGGRK